MLCSFSLNFRDQQNDEEKSSPGSSGPSKRKGEACYININELLHVYERRCLYCDKIINRSTSNREHVFPKSLGGSGGWRNIVLSCRECNSTKAAKIWDDLAYDKLSERCYDALTRICNASGNLSCKIKANQHNSREIQRCAEYLANLSDMLFKFADVMEPIEFRN